MLFLRTEAYIFLKSPLPAEVIMRYPVSKKKKKFRLILILFLLLSCFNFRACFFTDRFHLPFSLHFSQSYILLEPGEKYSLKINGIHLVATFHSSSSKIASVTQTGVVHAWKCGRTVITATIRNQDNKKIRCLVHVTKLNHSSLKLSPGQTKWLRIRGIYSGVSYKSSNPLIAAVNRFGKITAVSRGTVVITATAKGKTFRCTVTVD